MTPDSRPDPSELLADALERPAEERAAFLERACAGDSALRADVASLLLAHDSASGFLERPALLVVTGDRNSPLPPERLGRRFGPYRLVEEIGVGGMGAVYLAERADGSFEQRVAMKLLRTDLNTRELLRRFEDERRILARLEHPHIARLIDGGAAEDGVPFLVMEYVDGLPIDEHCRVHGLSVRARLELMRTVCDAVHHAHRNLIVHRDLKPSNILVDRSGRVKLLDFGIAKVLAPEPGEDGGAPTRTRVQALTPRYASPEQLLGEPVTTVSDVYSLGVVLYELLTSRSPYGEASHNDRELERAVLEGHPVRPSEAVRQGMAGRNPRKRAFARPSPQTGRRATERLARQLAGDLDTIVLQCLRAEPDRRYASAALISVTLAGATILSTSLYVRADRARAEAERQRSTAEDINAFLREILGSIDPQFARGRDTALLREILDSAAARVERELQDAPEIAATLQLTIGSAYRSLGLYQPAERHLRASWSYRRQELGDDDPGTAESAVTLARLLTDSGRYAEAESLARRAVGVYRAGGAETEADLALSLTVLATVHEAQSISEAEAGHREALETARRSFRSEEWRIASFLGNLGVFLNTHDRRAEAGPLLHEAVEILRRAPDTNPVELSVALHNLATFHRRDGRPEEAARLYRETLERMRAVYPADHPQIPVTLNNLATALEAVGRSTEAEAAYREALAQQRRVLGPGHRDVGTTTNNLAGLLRQLRRFDEAEPLYRETIRVYTQALGPDHAWLSIIWNNLAHLHEARGEHPAALAAADEARRIGRQHWPPEHWRLQQGESLRGACLAAAGRHTEAESLLVGSHRLLRSALPEKDVAVRLAAARLAAYYESRGRYAEAGEIRASVERADL